MGLRAEVETLLAMHEKAGEFLGSPAIEAVARQVSEKPPSLLGAGGMGEVYRARDTRLDIYDFGLPRSGRGD